jgi:hypothetical protein
MAATRNRKPAHDAFMKSLEHPHKAAIREGVKWNTPSFRTTEYFATTNLREKAGIGLVLHLGASGRCLPGGMALRDPG